MSLPFYKWAIHYILHFTVSGHYCSASMLLIFTVFNHLSRDYCVKIKKNLPVTLSPLNVTTIVCGFCSWGTNMMSNKLLPFETICGYALVVILRTSTVNVPSPAKLQSTAKEHIQGHSWNFIK